MIWNGIECESYAYHGYGIGSEGCGKDRVDDNGGVGDDNIVGAIDMGSNGKGTGEDKK